MNQNLANAIRTLARSPTLLAACDFDGTIAAIAPTPSDAAPMREAVAALRALSAMPGTTVAVISGRALGDLGERLGDAGSVRMVGSHGSEFEEGLARRLPPEAGALRDRIGAVLREIAAGAPGALVEEKPAGLALHTRLASDEDGHRAAHDALERVSSLAGVHTRRGKMVLEFSVIPINKGEALRRIRAEVSAGAALFIGDDETDEDAFAALAGPDVGVKVGEGPSRARFGVPDPIGAAGVLSLLVEARAAWLAGGASDPIERHTLLSDQRAAALLDTRGRVVWMCAPRIDSPAVFGDLVGAGSAGSFDVAPQDRHTPGDVSYIGDTLLARTRWPGLEVIDYLDCSAGRPYQRAGRTDLVRVVAGARRAAVRFAPRLDFGRLATRLALRPGGVVVEGTPDPISLTAPGVAWTLRDEDRHQVAHAVLEPRAVPYVLELRFGSESVAPDPTPEAGRRDQTERFWTSWARSLRTPELARDLVVRSALTLKALSHGPTGAIAAAATTSLPETIGGVRNWDYRFCWPRDACMAARSLLRLGNTGVGLRLLDWLLGVLERVDSPERLRPIYTVSGRDLPPEAEISELAGYAGSRPVRISNGAARQVQLDVFGPIVDLIAALAEAGAPLTPEHWRLTCAMVGAIAARWREPDAGIWEVRTAGRRHTHSAAMCWFGVHRAVRVAQAFRGEAPPEWLALAGEIRDDVLRFGWSNSLGAFGAGYDLEEPDAATLLIGLTGLLPPDDPRWLATLETVRARLAEGACVRRYDYDDGLPGREGGFLLCTGWLIQALAAAGRLEEARGLFEGLCRSAGPSGLLPEQVAQGPGGAGLGNHPQAYSHVAVIDSAVALAGAVGAK